MAGTLHLVLVACMAVSGNARAAYCEDTAHGTYCRMRIGIGSPDHSLYPEGVRTEKRRYCRKDEFDGGERCIFVDEKEPVVDAAIEFHRTSGGPWIIVMHLYTGDPEPVLDLLQIKVDGGEVITLTSAGSGRSSRGKGDFEVRGNFHISKEQLEIIANAADRVWFRMESADGKQRNLELESSRFALLNLFMAEASSAIQEP